MISNNLKHLEIISNKKIYCIYIKENAEIERKSTKVGERSRKIT